MDKMGEAGLAGSRPCSKTQESFASCQSRNNKQAVEAQPSIADLMHTTADSAALDLAKDRRLTLSPKIQSCKVTAGVYGTFPIGTLGMTLGRKSLTHGSSRNYRWFQRRN